MKARHPLVLDLNNFFSPAIKDGLKKITSFENSFHEMHRGIVALKQTGQLPFSRLPIDSVIIEDVITHAKEYSDVDNVIVLGIGGSALGAASLYQALSGPYANQLSHKPKLYVVDHIEPNSILDLCSIIEDDKNLFVFVSKSGNTSEILALLHFFAEQFKDWQAQKKFFITDAHDGFLHQYAQKNEFPVLSIPTGVGGRFSVFSPAGLFPLAVCGFDIENLLDGAKHVEVNCLKDVLVQNPAALLALSLDGWLKKKNFSQIVIMPYAERLRLFTDWFAQLWAESLGKKESLDGKKHFLGSTPIKSVGVTDQHSQLQLYLEGPRDKLILFLEVEEFDYNGMLSSNNFDDERIDFLAGKSLEELMMAEKLATEESLRENDRPNATVKLSMINEFQLGQLYQLFMNVIPYMGALLNINPFDQPAVEKIKHFTFGIMGRKGFEDYKAKIVSASKKKDLIF